MTYAITYSKRIGWNVKQNRLSKILEQKQSSGEKIFDLTESNPTTAHLNYPENDIFHALSSFESTSYRPYAQGSPEVRQAIVEYYGEHHQSLQKEQIIITSSTSEAYSYLFRLLADPNDTILVPQPCYPLFHYLAALEGIQLKHYQLVYKGHQWHIDMSSLKNAINFSTKAILLVNPNNPTGNFVKREEIDELTKLCLEHHLPLIIDEVFIDYKLDMTINKGKTLSEEANILTFVLSGLSKVSGLPQMKLSWIVVHGPEKHRKRTIHRLALIADMYLSVSEPIQKAASSYLALRKKIQPLIKNRVKKNLNLAKEYLTNTIADLLNVEGGWYGIIRLPNDRSDDVWTQNILQNCNVLLHPGYFYDFQEEAFIVFSSITRPNILQQGMQRLTAHLAEI